MRRLVLVAAVVSLVARSDQGQAQAPTPPTFRTGTTLVEVSAVVTRDGRPVTDLRPDEVTVLDNGAPQPLVVFEYVDLGRVEGPAQRRDFVLLLDDLHIHPSRTRHAQDVALAFIRALGPYDRLTVLTTARDDQQLDFTTERATAEALVRKVHGQMATGPGISHIERDFQARNAMQVLRGVATGVRSDAAERRAVFLVSEGHVMPGDGPPRGGDVPMAWYEYLAVLREAALSNVAIYAVDPRGLTTPGTGNAEVSSFNHGSGADRAAAAWGTPTIGGPGAHC